MLKYILLVSCLFGASSSQACLGWLSCCFGRGEAAIEPRSPGSGSRTTGVSDLQFASPMSGPIHSPYASTIDAFERELSRLRHECTILQLTVASNRKKQAQKDADLSQIRLQIQAMEQEKQRQLDRILASYQVK